MEKNLLSKLDPKGKEHQRKKVLRIFFSWNSKQLKPAPSLKFWNWVKNLSPDNQSSSERYKSMSYEFLDKLISKKVFRDSLSYWIDNVYMPTLTKSSEDEHTRYFLHFILNAISVKEFIEVSKQKYLQNLHAAVLADLNIKDVLEVPNKPGVYVEFECTKHACSFHKYKMYGFIEPNVCVDLGKLFRTVSCLLCHGNLKIFNIGVLACKYSLEGKTDNDAVYTVCDMVNYYNTIDEFHFYHWNELSVVSMLLNDDEKHFLDNLVFSSFSDPAVPKKKYCKRKNFEIPDEGVQNDLKASILYLEKELKDLDSQIYDLISDNYKNNKLIQDFKSSLLYDTQDISSTIE
jgi:hypothetical protein